MVRVYLKNGSIVKVIADGYFNTEWIPAGCLYQDVDFSIEDSLIYETGEIILYKDSEAIQTRKTELEAIEERTEQEQEELDYINGLLA